MEGDAQPGVTEKVESAGERRFAAPLVALLWGPVGHIAIGRWRRACVWYVAGAAIGVATLVGMVFGPAQAFWALLAAGVVGRLALVVDVARAPRQRPLPRPGVVLLLGLGVEVFYGILAMNVRLHVVEAFSMPSGSMAPTLVSGDHFLVTKVPRVFHRGDVVVFRYPLDHATNYVKRLVGLPGDRIAVRDGELVINDQVVARTEIGREPCEPDASCLVSEETVDGRSWRIMHEEVLGPRDSPEVVVAPGAYFVLGDNRDNSSDSRVWGFVPEDLMLGRATFIYWSSDKHGVRWNRIDRAIR